MDFPVGRLTDSLEFVLSQDALLRAGESLPVSPSE